MDHQVKYLLDESEMPRQWYNVIADLPSPPPPPLHPGTGQPVGPDDLAPLFPMALIAQEVSPDRFIDIPEPVTDVYHGDPSARVSFTSGWAIWSGTSMSAARVAGLLARTIAGSPAGLTGAHPTSPVVACPHIRHKRTTPRHGPV